MCCVPCLSQPSFENRDRSAPFARECVAVCDHQTGSDEPILIVETLEDVERFLESRLRFEAAQPTFCPSDLVQDLATLELVIDKRKGSLVSPKGIL